MLTHTNKTLALMIIHAHIYAQAHMQSLQYLIMYEEKPNVMGPTAFDD